MCAPHFAFESHGIEMPGLFVGLTFDQRSTDSLHLKATLLLRPDQVAYVFTVVGVVSSGDVSLDPLIDPAR